MSAETLARWQFGITTVYHFFFVPITIALSVLVAVLQTMWVRSGEEKFLRLTKFYGKLFLINFAMGVVTGIVQEFQFGMNWSEYSRFVGDIFGAPLALEALLAFFLESVFLGLWIFGWDRLPKKTHLLMIWLGSIGTVISSIFILLANSWMQNPVGATYDPTLRRAQMHDFMAVLTNPLGIVTITHVWSASAMTAGGLILGVAGWHLKKLSTLHADDTQSVSKSVPAFRWAAKFGAAVLLVSSVGVIITGDLGGKIIAEVQPYKIAIAEGLTETKACAPFQIIPGVEVPCIVSMLSSPSYDPNTVVMGTEEAAKLNDAWLAGTEFKPTAGVKVVTTELQATFNAEDSNIDSKKAIVAMYKDFVDREGVTGASSQMIAPNFWSFRLMMLLGGIAFVISIVVLLKLKGPGDKLPKLGKVWNAAMIAVPLLPLFGSSFGWLLAELGRQPWLVNGVVPTAAAVSPGVTAFEVGLTMVLYTAIYGVFAVVEVGLMLNTIKKGLPTVKEPEVLSDDDATLTFAY